MFHVIQDGYCITRNKRGIYKQAKVYHYKHGLYVGVSGGYTRLCKNGEVGTPDLSYVELELPHDIALASDNIGRLVIDSGVNHGGN